MAVKELTALLQKQNQWKDLTICDVVLLWGPETVRDRDTRWNEIHKVGWAMFFQKYEDWQGWKGQPINGEIGPDCVFGKEGKLGKVSRGKTPLTKSFSDAKDHSLISVGWCHTMKRVKKGQTKETDVLFPTFDVGIHCVCLFKHPFINCFVGSHHLTHNSRIWAWSLSDISPRLWSLKPGIHPWIPFHPNSPQVP